MPNALVFVLACNPLRITVFNDTVAYAPRGYGACKAECHVATVWYHELSFLCVGTKNERRYAERVCAVEEL
ncbi:hypothetical protein ZHAS_00001842 [Anopheles sinensis]|uniref:Uncharacterized protein n=1 Tax=Anopheles sinensis TaxID=74873 RepID=A0A084VBL0_ANOSI|nr:hypothetical protein ZHAS_00001842 [Anopheles sinensis]